MPVDQTHYSSRGGGNYGIVALFPTVVGDRLVYFDYNRDRGSWVIRDFRTGNRLDNEHSHLTVDEIEQDAIYSEYPPWHNVEEHPENWKLYLRLRTTAVFPNRQQGRSIDPPNPASGRWQAL